MNNNKCSYLPFEKLFEWGEKSSIKSGDGKVSGEYKMFICSDTETKRYDDYLMNKEVLVFGTGGKASCHYANEPFAYSTDCVVAYPKSPDCSCKFYYYYLRQNRLGQLQSTFSGSGLQHTSKKKINTILVPILPQEEQKRIVSKIENQFSQLYRAEETLIKVKHQLSVFRQAILNSAFHNISQEDFFPLKKALECTPQNGLYKPKSAYGTGTKILRIDGFYDGKILSDYDFKKLSLTKSEIERYRLNEDDIIINRVNSMPYLGKCALVENINENIVYESNLMRLHLKSKVLNPKYTTYYLSSHSGRMELIKNAKQAVNQASINQEDVGSALVPMPQSIDEQIKTVKKIDICISIYDNICFILNDTQKQIDEMRQSILKKAFEFKL